MFIKNAIRHFIEFHKGIVNIVLHIIGFVGIAYSIVRSDGILFAFSLLILESGHFYNHFKGIKKYESNPRVNVWRAVVFIAIVVLFFIITRAFNL